MPMRPVLIEGYGAVRVGYTTTPEGVTVTVAYHDGVWLEHTLTNAEWQPYAAMNDAERFPRLANDFGERKEAT